MEVGGPINKSATIHGKVHHQILCQKLRIIFLLPQIGPGCSSWMNAFTIILPPPLHSVHFPKCFPPLGHPWRYCESISDE